MKTIHLIVSALAIFLQNWSLSSASLEENCKRIHELDPYRSYDFCVTSLQVVPESHTANLSQLAVIASELTIKNYTYTLDVVQQLLKNQSLSHWQREALRVCNEIYTSEIGDVNLAITEIKSDDFSSAQSNLSAAAIASDTCESSFKEGHIPSMIPRENALTYLISYLALDILELLTRA
uniref:Pectinesterase inhibitor domain-containing protein n=1 Tax=Ananas comosus var. bracteatus TaxID=296719 RepID=A0A6V7P3R3_ANACO|nr:unnamed protein product [Ananas comosus var. bracteatus]